MRQTLFRCRCLFRFASLPRRHYCSDDAFSCSREKCEEYVIASSGGNMRRRAEPDGDVDVGVDGDSTDSIAFTPYVCCQRSVWYGAQRRGVTGVCIGRRRSCDICQPAHVLLCAALPRRHLAQGLGSVQSSHCHIPAPASWELPNAPPLANSICPRIW